MIDRGDHMGQKGLSRTNLLLLLILLAISLGGCGWGEFGDSNSNNWSYRLFSWESKTNVGNARNLRPGTYPVDLLFIDFYHALGGEGTLGPAISIVETSDGLTKQYTVAGLMIFDPTAAESSRFALAPLGLELGAGDGDVLGKAYATGRIINGYLVRSEFLEEYERLGGARFVGKPISEAQYNAEKGRSEQYFENLGFFQLDGEPKIRMMPYGAYACDRNCRNQEPIAGIPVLQSILPDTFLKKTIELGLPFVGKPLTGVHFTPDGKQEVIFENLVLVAENDSLLEVSVRPMVDQIGLLAQDPAKSQNSPLSVFYEIDEGFGYDVPLYFVEFLEANGGTEIAGTPISHVFSHEPGIYWQCFTNLCLQFNLNVEGEERLRPVPLGVEYKDRYYDEVIDFLSSQAMEDLEMKVWEKDSFVSSNGSQIIHLALFEGRKPLKDFEPILIATMPDGSQRKAYFQPSDENGRTSIGLAPIDAPNGTLIAYKVCLYNIESEPRCVGDNYLIWDSD
jgi:hypothetical protein